MGTNNGDHDWWLVMANNYWMIMADDGRLMVNTGYTWSILVYDGSWCLSWHLMLHHWFVVKQLYAWYAAKNVVHNNDFYLRHKIVVLKYQIAEQKRGLSLRSCLLQHRLHSCCVVATRPWGSAKLGTMVNLLTVSCRVPVVDWLRCFPFATQRLKPKLLTRLDEKTWVVSVENLSSDEFQ